MQSVYVHLVEWCVLPGCVCVSKREQLLVIWVTGAIRLFQQSGSPGVWSEILLQKLKLPQYDGWGCEEVYTQQMHWITNLTPSRLNLLECFVPDSYMSLGIFFIKLTNVRFHHAYRSSVLYPDAGRDTADSCAIINRVAGQKAAASKA